nr:hypothetical protein HK105_000723 [Polyrhizophydium stewartii]
MPKAKLERFNPIPPVLPGTTTAGKPGQVCKTPYSKLSLEEKTVSMRQESTPSRESESWADDKHDASEPSMQQLKMQRRETQG